jgi:hypothetical protein
MYQFTGHAALFNGKYWASPVTLRVQASNLSGAISKGIRLALKEKRKGERIQSATITLERLGRIEK